MKNPNLKWMPIVLLVLGLSVSCANDNDDFAVIEPEGITNETTQLIIDWNNLWLEIDRSAFGMRPTATARSLAYIHLAAYETCVYDMEGYASNEARFLELTIDDSQRAIDIDINIALNTCYSRVMEHFMYNVTGGLETLIGQLEEEKDTQFSAGLSNDLLQDSRDWGNYVAERVIAYSQTDIEAEQQILEPQPLSYEPPVGDGFWTYSADEERALFPYWESVRTFVISSEETTTNPPSIIYNETTNSSYYNEMYEVYESNNAAKVEDNDDLWIAEFWSNDVEGLMMSPPGRQFSIAGQLVEQFDLDSELTLELFLKLGFSLNDAAVSCWADKYEYMVMRPNVYIEEFIDSEYETNLYRLIFWPNPSFPGYPSGHSTFASAAAGIMINVFGNDINFTDRTHEGETEFRGAPRAYNALSDMAEENAFSRIPLGVHMRIDCTEGYRLGYEISDAVNGIDLSIN
ncbi:vanadium-dependent haloperoxidase [uncultured Psychroserpens sp.]|uniref:vanadium-dependent haloperoxidase n=1 Tax=uncultured Psychroserpens sp. TaxID=255436 RepID=UPI00260D0975|nr:vanadium-dependent haloperoxidase [uncultured Psychroserpens sp.]